MEIEQPDNPNSCCISKINGFEFCVFLFGGLHIIVFILLILAFISERNYASALFALSILGVLFSILSIVGTAKKKKHLVFPWLIFGMIFIVFEFVYGFFLSDEILLKNVVFTGFSIAYWFCNLRVYREIAKLQENSNRTNV